MKTRIESAKTKQVFKQKLSEIISLQSHSDSALTVVAIRSFASVKFDFQVSLPTFYRSEFS